MKNRTDMDCRIGHFSRGFHWTRVKNGPFLKFDFLDYRLGKQWAILAVADLRADPAVGATCRRGDELSAEL